MAFFGILKRYYFLEVAAVLVGMFALFMVHNAYSLYQKINQADSVLLSEQAEMKEDLLLMHILLHEQDALALRRESWRDALAEKIRHLHQHHQRILEYLNSGKLAVDETVHQQLQASIDGLWQWHQIYVQTPPKEHAQKTVFDAFDYIYLPMLDLVDAHRDEVLHFVDRDKRHLEQAYAVLLSSLCLMVLGLVVLFFLYQRRMQGSRMQLQQAVLFNEAINENLIDGVITIDERGRIEYVNPATEKIFGYGRAELLGENISILMGHTDAHAHDDYMQKYQRYGVKKIIGIGREVIGRKKDGSLFPISLGVSEYYVGGRRHYAGVLRDVSEQKSYEQRLLAEKDRAEIASKAKTEFLAGMTHEVRTPLNGVMGLLELLKTSELNEEDRGYVDIAYDSANCLLKLLESVLEYSRMESGDMQIDEMNFQLRPFLLELQHFYQLQAQQKQLNLSLSVDESAPQDIHTDPLLLRHLFERLLDNAIKFTDAGEVQINAKLEQVGAADVLYFEVCDTGIGVDEEYRQEIFNAFKQADGSFTRSYGGVGLGLAIAKKIAGSLDAEIGLAPRPQGSCFWLRLPLKAIEVTMQEAV